MTDFAVQSLADLLDSRQDLREILAKNMNLAHACLLLRRGESESVEKALELALRQPEPDVVVIAECIRVELLRQSGDAAQVLARAETLARSHRFHPAAVLYLRNLFPLIETGDARAPAPEPPPPPAPPPPQALDEPSPDSAIPAVDDSLAMEPHQRTAEGPEDVPPAWSHIASDPSVVLLHLRSSADVSEVRHEAISISAIEDAALVRSAQILSRLGFGALRHCSIDGSERCLHAWSAKDRSALIVMATGESTSLLAARCTKAFQDQQ